MSHARYDAYKDSGAPWLGDIPDYWNSVRIKNVISKITSGVTPRGGAESYVDVGIPFLRSQNVHNDGLHLDDVSFISSSTHQEMMNSQVKPGDIVFNITGASIARTCIVPESIKTANISQHIALLKLNKSNETKFISYYLQSPFVKDYVYLTQSGASKEAFNHGQMKCIPVALPPRAEQAAIAAYLDTKTTQLDRKIDLLGQKAAQYSKLKQSLINETVTRGLDKTVAMKDSGVEWLGEVPRHWEIKRLKDFIRYTIGGEVIDVSYWNAGTELTYTAGKYPVNSNFNNFPDRKRTKINDILIARNGDGFVHIPKLNSIFTNVVQLVRLSKLVDVRFVYYSLENIKYLINKTSNGDLIASLNKEMWFNSFLITPKMAEQQAIAAYLDEKTAHIDRIVATLNSQIDRLKELRKTLINDIVTGKICIFKQEASHE